MDAKVDAISRIMHEQQAELSDSYRFAAGCKVAVALERRITLALAFGFGSWRRATA